MHPVLFKISFVEARSYYMLWASALLVFVFWTRRRAEKLYGIDYNDCTSVLLWVYCAGIVGSSAASILTRLPLYFSGKVTLSYALKGMTSWGGMLAGGAAGLWRLRRLHISTDAFADAAALPAAAMLAIGRLGCFMEGCCAGAGCYCHNAPWWAVHFGFDPAGYVRFPSQLLESSASFLILIFLWCVQRFLSARGKLQGGGILFPIFLILYGAFRLLSDPMREVLRNSPGQQGGVVWTAAIVIGALWLAASCSRYLRKTDQ